MYDVKNVDRSVRELNQYMLNKTISMFDYKGLPPTIPKKELELILQKNGYAFYIEINGTPRILTGGLGGEPDEFGNPTQINVSNPALNISETFNIKNEGVMIYNDSMGMGIVPLMEKFHRLMSENQLNMEMLTFNTRIFTFLSAGDNKTLESANNFVKKIESGERTVVADNAMFDGVKNHSNSNSGAMPITELIEYQHYLKSSIYAELGINAPFNMKREKVNSGEVAQHEDQLSIFVDNMKECRDDALKLINEKYGDKITCEFAGIWGKKREQESKKPIIESSKDNN